MFGIGIGLHEENQRIGAIITVKKLTTGRTCAPNDNLLEAVLFGVVNLADQRRQDMT